MKPAAEKELTGKSSTIKRPRRTQEERSSSTRRALFEAAVRCLFEHGYGSTTTTLVAEEAGVSRGAMLHQFRAKADLMTFVVETAFEEEAQMYAELLKGIDAPRERLAAYPMAVWKVLSRPTGVAVLEILQGSRSDPVLAKKLKPAQARIERMARAALSKEFPRGVSDPLLDLIVGAVRGLSISQILTADSRDVTASIRLLESLLRAGAEAGLLSTNTASGNTRRGRGPKSG